MDVEQHYCSFDVNRYYCSFIGGFAPHLKRDVIIGEALFANFLIFRRETLKGAMKMEEN